MLPVGTTYPDKSPRPLDMPWLVVVVHVNVENQEELQYSSGKESERHSNRMKTVVDVIGR